MPNGKDTQPEYGVKKIKLDNGLDAHPLNKAGHVVHVIEASSPQAHATVAINQTEESELQLSLYRGRGWRHGRYSRLFLWADAQPGEWLRILTAGPPEEADPALFDLYDNQPFTNGPREVTKTGGDGVPTSTGQTDSYQVRHPGERSVVTFEAPDGTLTLQGSNDGGNTWFDLATRTSSDMVSLRLPAMLRVDYDATSGVNTVHAID
jgi:hypothetical protein